MANLTRSSATTTLAATVSATTPISVTQSGGSYTVTAQLATNAEAVTGTSIAKLMTPAADAAALAGLRDELEPQIEDLGADYASLNGVIAGLSAEVTGRLSLADEDYTYSVINASFQRIAGHRPGEAFTIYATDQESIEDARRISDPSYVAEIAIEGYAQFTKDANGQIIDGALPGAIPVMRGANAFPSALYSEGYDPLQAVFSIGSNDLVTPSVTALPDPYTMVNTCDGQSYASAGANGDLGNTPFSDPARDSGVYTMSNATGGTFFRVSTSDAAFDSPGITALMGIDYYSGATRVISESVFPECFNQIGVLQQAAQGFKTKMHLVASGRGGYSINELKPGCPQYKAIIRQHRIDKAFLVAAGRIPIPGAIFWIQGEEDYNTPVSDLVPAYDATFQQLHRDICAIYGVHTPMKVIVYCPMRGPYDADITLVCQSTQAYFELARLFPANYAIAGPAFAAEHASDQHPTIKGYRQLGAMLARCFFNFVFGHGPAHPMYVDTVNERIVKLSATTFLLPVKVPSGSTLARQAGTSPIGNPVSNADAAYIGGATTDPRFGRDGGIWAIDYRGLQVGVKNALVGTDIPDSAHRANFAGGHQPLFIELATTPAQGCSLQIASYSQNGASGGTQADGPRNLFYATGNEFSIPTTYPDADPETFPIRLCPQRVELPV